MTTSPMNRQPTPRPGILDIAPYVPGSAGNPGGQKIYKLSSNESALGASDEAIAAYREAALSLHLYPDGSAGALRAKLAETYELDAARLICGAGSDELIQLLTRAYVGAGDNIVMSEHGFLMYAIAAKAVGATPKKGAEKNLTANVDALLSEVDEKTRIVFLANPNNPTGTYIPNEEVRRLREGLRDDVILVLDAAYAEYMEDPAYPDYNNGADMVATHDNVVMLRTFSKIYGLGGLRIGWGYFPSAIADVINRIRGPFNMNAAAIAAGVAALNDQAFVDRNRQFNREERHKMATAIEVLGLDVTPSAGNFLLVKFPTNGEKSANRVQAHLTANGIMVREMHPYNLSDYLRISVGDAQANEALVSNLESFFRD